MFPNGDVYYRIFEADWSFVAGAKKNLDLFHKTLRGLELRILVGPQYPRVFKKGEKYIGVDIKILEIIAEKENFSVRQIELLDKDPSKKITAILNGYTADLTVLTTKMYANELFNKPILTNDENAYCAIIPHSTRLSLLYFLHKPFDIWSWGALTATIFLCTILWQRVTRNWKMAFHFVFFFFAGLVGQSVELNINKRVLVPLVQICILMSLILSNAYQSTIISNLATLSRFSKQMSNFDQLLHSDMSIKADEVFRFFINDTVDRSAISRIEALQPLDLDGRNGRSVAIIHSCDQIDHIFFEGSFLLFEYYILPEKIMNYIQKFYLSHASPWHDILQKGFDRTFETGIRQYWKKHTAFRRDAFQKVQAMKIHSEVYLLSFKDLSGVFWILCIGLGLSVFVWLLELNWKNIKISISMCERTNIRKYVLKFRSKKTSPTPKIINK